MSGDDTLLGLLMLGLAACGQVGSVQEAVDDPKDELLPEVAARLKQALTRTELFTVRWKVEWRLLETNAAHPLRKELAAGSRVR